MDRHDSVKHPDTQRSARALPLVGIVLIGFFACGEDGPGGRADRAHNAGTRIDIPVDSVHVVGTSDDIALIRDVMPTDAGTVWVLNTAEPFFVALGPDGSVVRTAGRRGDGPREFRAPGVFVRHPLTHEVWVYDRNAARNAFVGIAGPEEEWPELRLPTDSLPASRVLYPHFAGNAVSQLWLRQTDDRFVLSRARNGFANALALWHADILAVDPGDASLETVLPLADLLGDPATRYGTSTILLPYPLWDLCPADRSVAVYDPLRNTIRRFAADGTERDSIRLPPERLLEVTANRIFDMILSESAARGGAVDTAQQRSEFDSAWEEAQSMFADVFPEYVGLECLEDGAIWIQPFDLQSPRFGLGGTWSRIGPDSATTTITLPDVFVPMRFATGRIWGTVADEFGIQSVAWISLPHARDNL